MKKAFDSAQWDSARNRLVEALQELDAEGYPSDMIADVAMAVGVHLIERVYGRDALLEHLARLAMIFSDPNFDPSSSGGSLQ